MVYNAHEGLLASYETGLLNHADYLEPLLQARGLLQGVSTLLSIGIGAGHLECRLARGRGLSLSYVERSPAMLEALRRNIDHHRIGARIGQAFEGPFEEFPVDASFDLILSLDSWYHIGPNRAVLEKALGLRAPGGRLLIQLMNHDRQLYWVLDQVRGLISSNALSTWARARGFHHDYFECSQWIPVAHLLPDGCPTEEFKHFVAFAKGQPWDEQTERERDRAIEAVASLQRDGSIETRHGYLLFD